ncbi:MAG TPA: 2-C-methyl-D-erythritol 4-phosphate cytidylyltransferase [Chthoniobacterales bacterium]|jgi:2-C-methyl-D-erythritol 4-phosphate cytidylyltransferase|nr:2-C-methyl-D-erythritol 4-phosphate cytidylyltransferase [Chthoniobacterales bacterium]
MLTAIIVAGGRSQRMGFDKLFAPLDGKPVVMHSIAAFEQTASVADIVLVARADRLADYEEVIRAGDFRKVVTVIPGGERRQDSVQRGLEQIGAATDFVAVHDAARPLVRPELVERILQLAREQGGAASGAPIRDTLKRVDQQRVVTGGIARENLVAVETPQIFRRELLIRAYAAVDRAAVEVTDEISAVEQVGGKVVLVPNDEPNFKITYPADLALAEFVLRQRAGEK